MFENCVSHCQQIQNLTQVSFTSEYTPRGYCGAPWRLVATRSGVRRLLRIYHPSRYKIPSTVFVNFLFVNFLFGSSFCARHLTKSAIFIWNNLRRGKWLLNTGTGSLWLFSENSLEENNFTSVVLVNDQLDAQFFFLICLFQFSTCFEHLVLIIKRMNCINTTSGICHSV
jgi:hypothetical protein